MPIDYLTAMDVVSNFSYFPGSAEEQLNVIKKVGYTKLKANTDTKRIKTSQADERRVFHVAKRIYDESKSLIDSLNPNDLRILKEAYYANQEVKKEMKKLTSLDYKIENVLPIAESAVERISFVSETLPDNSKIRKTVDDVIGYLSRTAKSFDVFIEKPRTDLPFVYAAPF
jgi:hypothetical protein